MELYMLLFNLVLSSVSCCVLIKIYLLKEIIYKKVSYYFSVKEIAAQKRHWINDNLWIIIHGTTKSQLYHFTWLDYGACIFVIIYHVLF